MVKKTRVDYTSYPSMAKHKIGFKTKDQKPVEPYFHDGASFLHINGEDEFNALLAQINGLTYEQFKLKYGIPKKESATNDYIMYIDQRIKDTLLTAGIYLTVTTNNSKEDVCFFAEIEQYIDNVTVGKGYFVRG